MDPQVATGQGPGKPSAGEAPSAEAGFATADLTGQETEKEMAMDQLASGAQSIPHDIPTRGEAPSSEEEGFAVDKEADGDMYAQELSEGPPCPPMEQVADLSNEHWDLELKMDQGNPYNVNDIHATFLRD